MIRKMKKKMDDGQDEDYFTDEDIEQKKIVKNSKGYEYIFNIDEDINSPSTYRGIFKILTEASEQDTIILNINSPGGYVCTAVQFYDKLISTKAKTIANIYTAYSAAAVIGFMCSEINFKKHSSCMIHSMSSGAVGRIEEIKSYAEFASKQDMELTADIFQGFLTKEELKAVHKGKEIWLDKTECDKRIKNWKPLKQRLLKEK